ncbi:MAG: cohesin domain-containing protein [Chloroflexi bacterium]|nr:cohesin domain-containing protein [Chloroflexota bacterium]
MRFPKFILIVILIFISLPALPVQAQDIPSVGLDPPYTLLNCTCDEYYKIMVYNASSLYAFDISIKFDPSSVQVVDMDPKTPGVQIRQGDFLENGYVMLNRVDNVAGTIRYAATQVRPQLPKNGSGPLLDIVFSALKVGISSVIIEDPQLSVTGGTLDPTLPVDGTLDVRALVPGQKCPPTPTPILPATKTALPGRTPAPAKTRQATITPIPATITKFKIPTRQKSATSRPTSSRTPQKIEPATSTATPTPVCAACACTPAASAGFDPGAMIKKFVSGPQVYLLVCPADILFVTIIILIYVLRREEPEDPQDEIDYQI